MKVCIEKQIYFKNHKNETKMLETAIKISTSKCPNLNAFAHDFYYMFRK